MMSRQNTLSTQYNRQRLTTIITILGATGLVAIFSIFASIILNSSDSVLDTLETNNDPIPTIITEKPTSTPLPTARFATPTPLPTLTQEQYDAFIGEFESKDPELFENVPNEAINELQNAIEQSQSGEVQPND